MWLLVPKQEFQHLAVEFVPFVTFVLYIAAVAVFRRKVSNGMRRLPVPPGLRKGWPFRAEGLCNIPALCESSDLCVSCSFCRILPLCLSLSVSLHLCTASRPACSSPIGEGDACKIESPFGHYLKILFVERELKIGVELVEKVESFKLLFPAFPE